MKLYIDIGNSRIRLATDAGRVEPAEFDYHADTLASILDAYGSGLPAAPERVLIANVAGEQTAIVLTSVCRARWSLVPEYVHAVADGYGLRNAYTEPERLGADRWLAMIAARKKYHGRLCVIDCGSAVTADLIEADGTHVGGYIVPGLRLMQRALERGTGQIRLTEPYRYTGRPGRSTEECVYNGTTLAVAGFVEALLSRINHGTDGERWRCVLTGGGAETVSGLLRVDFHHEPHLVIEGLAIVGAD